MSEDSKRISAKSRRKKEESSSEQMEDMLRQELSSKGAAPDRLAQYWNTFSRIKIPLY